MTKYCLIKTTFTNKTDAKRLLKILFENKLIACAQISTIESFYFWDDEIKNEPEFLLSIKTKVSFYKDIEKIIINNHSYDIPQIIAVPIIEGSKPYLNWIESCLH